MSIRPLPPEVIAQIRSSITITSLNGVICALAKNSLDASATKIEISVDYTRGGCVVEDDGVGIHPFEFGEDGGLGKLYHSSKLSSQTPVHGGRGTFLAALSAMALMSITSQHHLHRSHNTINMHKSEVVSRQTPAPPQQHLSNKNHGTRVTIRDLFGNMPVRVKQRAIAAEKQQRCDRDWVELKRDIVMLLLSWSSHVAVTVRELDSSQKLVVRPPVRFNEETAENEVDMLQVCGILAQAGLIAPDEKTFWVPVGISTQSLEIRGTISLQPSAVKHLQYISFGIHPLKVEGPSILHDEINRLFSNSSFGNKEELSDIDDAERARRAKDQRLKGDGYTNKELKGVRKSVDRWPMFYISIDQLRSAPISRQLNPDGILDDTSNRLIAITELLQVMVMKFLTVHHFRPKPVRGQRSRKHEPANLSAPASRSGSPSPTRPSTSPYRTGVQKTSKSSDATTSFDLLGSNVKLPSFRRALSKPEKSFEGWSTSKSGAIQLGSGLKEQKGESQNSCAVARPSSAPPLRAITSEELTSNRPQTPLISQNGKLLRRPFEDVITAKPRTKAVAIPLAHTFQTTETTVRDGDELVAWLNPVTKVRSMVNRRTGMTIPAENEKWVGRLSIKPSISGQVSTRIGTELSSTWVKNVLQNWDNPVFSTVEPTIPQVMLEGSDEHTQSILTGRYHHCSQVDVDRAFKESSASVSGRISKSALKDAKVISQVDRKFILVKVQATPMKVHDPHDDTSILVLVDQHAADERIRLEALMDELCTPPNDASMLADSPVQSTLLNKPLIFEIALKEVQVLRTSIPYFANWGIIYEVASSSKGHDNESKTICRLSVRSLPPGIIERSKHEPRLLVELIRTEAWKAHESGKTMHSISVEHQTWLQRTQSCPQGILDMLNSRACRGAIMFNDGLSKTQCEKLVRKLANCKFPFQCAHGRPSLVPLVDISTLKDAGHEPKNMLDEHREASYGHAFRRWKHSVSDAF